LAVLSGAAALGLVHGAEPGHGWPIAATYGLDREPAWGHGLAASVLLGLGHLVSSLAVVGVFFLVKTALDLERLHEPLLVLGVPVGGPVGIVAGLLLVGLGVREYRRGHHAGRHDHGGEPLGRPSEHPGGANSHDHFADVDVDRAGLASLVWTAFLLGFIHEEEVEIIGLCLGASACLELMLVYAVAVLVSLVAMTMLLIAGYYRYEDRLERYAEHFPTVSAVVLVGMGLGFALGLF
jgi:ABC-type nickel/cobalt efflux system permease component RcnA